MDMTVTLGALGSVCTITAFGAAILNQVRKNRRENEADRKLGTDEIKREFKLVEQTLDQRLSKVEYKITDFMPRREIEERIEHEKVNRQQADEQLRMITERLSNDVRDMMVTQGRIEQQQLATSGSVNEIKTTLKDFSREMSSRFDKVADTLSELSRKVQH